MTIYGTALLAFCHLFGVVVGDLLGAFLGCRSNVGGVGIAMLTLILLRIRFRRWGWLTEAHEVGVHYWGALYIPVVVAMAMQQNVVSALDSGLVAVLAAGLSVVSCMACVALINRMERRTGVAVEGGEEEK